MTRMISQVVMTVAMSVLVLGTSGCSLFVPWSQSVTITATDLEAAIYVDGQFKGKGTVIVSLRRNESHAVMAKVWEHKHGGKHASDADRLPNGNTLITLPERGEVIEVTPKGKVMYVLGGLSNPYDADRLANGHTLVACENEVAEYDAKGKKIWSAKVKAPLEVNRY